jgi:hypothetical protein
LDPVLDIALNTPNADAAPIATMKSWIIDKFIDQTEKLIPARSHFLMCFG